MRNRRTRDPELTLRQILGPMPRRRPGDLMRTDALLKDVRARAEAGLTPREREIMKRYTDLTMPVDVVVGLPPFLRRGLVAGALERVEPSERRAFLALRRALRRPA